MKFFYLCLVPLFLTGCATTQDVQRLQDNVNQQNSEISSLKSDISYLKGRLESMQSTMETMQASMSHLGSNQSIAVPEKTKVQSVVPSTTSP